MNKKTRLSVSSVFMLSSPWGESHCSMSLLNLIPLSSQTVLTTLVSPHNLPCITCANLFCQTGSYTVHSWSFLAFYHRSSTNVELQLHSAAQLSPLGQVYAGFKAVTRTIPYSSKVRNWGREMNKYIALWTHGLKSPSSPSFSLLLFHQPSKCRHWPSKCMKNNPVTQFSM